MGKSEKKNADRQQSDEPESSRGSSGLLCHRCSVALDRVAKEFSFKCFFVLVLTLLLLVYGIFSILPFHSAKYGFDAKDAIKLSATVQSYFRLYKPVSQLVPHIGKLEYDIYGEVGVPDTKVAILSMHQSGASNWTDVVFGVLSDPINVPINPVSQSVLRSSLIELFLQQLNLTLTPSIFGKTSMFEILKIPGGITVIPVQSASIWQIPQIQFNFTLNNSISDMLENFIEFKDQLKLGLYLTSYENVFVQITNEVGSTIAPPVTVEASVMSPFGSLLPQRLKQLAQIIRDSQAKNLGLDNTVFGKVKSIRLSSYLEGNLHAPSPSPSPAPSPELSDYAEPSISPYPARSPFNYPRSSSNIKPPSPAPSMVTTHPRRPCPYYGFTNPPSSSPASHSNRKLASLPSSPPLGPTSQLSTDWATIPQVSYASSTSKDKGSAKGLVSPSSLAATFYQKVWILGFSGLLMFHLFCWSA